jgi:uncharacterized protein
MRKPIFLIAAMAATAAVASPMQTDNVVKAGVDAWSRGEYKKAVDQWRGPAGRGDADAQFNMGQAYKLGRGVTADLAAAEEWYRKAAVQGHRQAEDNYGLSLFQNNKRGEAVKWLEKSVARGEPRAQFVLGTMLFNGDVVQKDWVRAYALMVRANAVGLPQAAASLAQMDRYVGLQERQQGLALARRYEAEGGRAPMLAEATAPAARTEAPPTRAATPPAPTPSRPAPKPAAERPAPTPAAAPRRDGGWRVQLGAFRDAGNARGLWSKLSGNRALAGTQPSYPKAGAVTRLLVGPFASSAEASRACASIKSTGTPCLPVRN